MTCFKAGGDYAVGRYRKMCGKNAPKCGEMQKMCGSHAVVLKRKKIEKLKK